MSQMKDYINDLNSDLAAIAMCIIGEENVDFIVRDYCNQRGIISKEREIISKNIKKNKVHRIKFTTFVFERIREFYE
jgi:hypothetical protein